jgi:hypothetical protein
MGVRPRYIRTIQCFDVIDQHSLRPTLGLVMPIWNVILWRGSARKILGWAYPKDGREDHRCAHHEVT